MYRRVKPVLYYIILRSSSVREGRTTLSDVSGSVCGTQSSPRNPLQSFCIYIYTTLCVGMCVYKRCRGCTRSLLQECTFIVQGVPQNDSSDLRTKIIFIVNFEYLYHNSWICYYKSTIITLSFC